MNSALAKTKVYGVIDVSRNQQLHCHLTQYRKKAEKCEGRWLSYVSFAVFIPQACTYKYRTRVNFPLDVPIITKVWTWTTECGKLQDKLQKRKFNNTDWYSRAHWGWTTVRLKCCNKGCGSLAYLTWENSDPYWHCFVAMAVAFPKAIVVMILRIHVTPLRISMGIACHLPRDMKLRVKLNFTLYKALLLEPYKFSCRQFQIIF